MNGKPAGLSIDEQEAVGNIMPEDDTPEMNRIDAKAKAALEMGLSYGKYVAWQRGLLRVKGFDDNGKTT